MKRSGLVLSLTISVFLILQLSGCSNRPVFEPKYSEDKVIPIGAWVSPPNEFISGKTYKDIADSGINIIYGLYEGAGADAMKALELAKANGIKYLMRDTSLSTMHEEDFDLLGSMVSKYKDHPALAGNLVSDEPGPSKFPLLKKLKDEYKKLMPGKIFYVNLFPTYSSLAQRDGLNYKDYINSYLKVVQPDFISFDYYPLMKNIDGNIIREDYLYNLEVVSNAARKVNIPFWSFVQAMGYSTAGMTNRKVTEQDIRFQVYTELAFGAKGIQYFCYWTPKNDGLAVFGDAMVDKDGNKTPTYEAVKNVNRELLAFDNIYMNFENKGTMIFPKDNLPGEAYMESPLAAFKPIKEVSCDNPAVVGCFEDKDGNQALILVNYTDPSKKLSNTVDIKFKGVREVSVFNKGVKERIKLKAGEYRTVLEPGEGEFILLLK